MDSIVDTFKRQARELRRQVRSGDDGALSLLRREPALRGLDAPQLTEQLRLRHCLAAVSRRAGLRGWSHLTALLSDKRATDFNALFYPDRRAAHWNIWFATYEEAHAVRVDHGGYLLPYRHQFFVCEGDFIRELGVDPDQPAWGRIGRDWVEPGDYDARHHLLGEWLRAAAGRHQDLGAEHAPAEGGGNQVC